MDLNYLMIIIGLSLGLCYFFYTKEEELLEPFFRKLRTRKVEKNLPKDREKIVDVGCGNMQFLNRVNFNSKIGIDRCLPIVYNQDALEGIIKIEDNSVSCVTFMASLEHFGVKKSEKLIKEAYRILNQGGRLIITAPTKRSKILIDLLAFLRLISKDLADEHHYFTKDWMLSAIKKVGFNKIKYKKIEAGFNCLVVAEK